MMKGAADLPSFSTHKEGLRTCSSGCRAYYSVRKIQQRRAVMLLTCVCCCSLLSGFVDKQQFALPQLMVARIFAVSVIFVEREGDCTAASGMQPQPGAVQMFKEKTDPHGAKSIIHDEVQVQERL